MLEAAHQSVDCRSASGLRCILLQPFPKGRVQGLMLRAGDQPGLLDQGFVRAQSNVLHTSTVYTILVCTASRFFLSISVPSIRLFIEQGEQHNFQTTLPAEEDV